MNRLASVALVLATAVASALPSCETYEAPPRASIVGLSSGILTDPRAPLVIDLGTPVDPATLFVKVALFEPDMEGDLPDEDSDPATELRVLARRDPLDGDL